MTVPDINSETDTVFNDFHGFLRHIAVDDALARFEAFLEAHIAVAALENASAAGLLREERIDVVPEAFRARGENFNGVDVRVLVDDAARDAVVFRVDEAERAEFVCNIEPAVPAPCDGAVEDCGKIFFGDGRLVAERPETPADLGAGGLCGES